MRELQRDGCVGTWLCGFWLGAGAVSSNIDAWPWIILCLGSCLLPDSSQQSLRYLFICFHNLSKEFPCKRRKKKQPNKIKKWGRFRVFYRMGICAGKSIMTACKGVVAQFWWSALFLPKCHWVKKRWCGKVQDGFSLNISRTPAWKPAGITPYSMAACEL